LGRKGRKEERGRRKEEGERRCNKVLDCGEKEKQFGLYSRFYRLLGSPSPPPLAPITTNEFSLVHEWSESEGEGE